MGEGRERLDFGGQTAWLPPYFIPQEALGRLHCKGARIGNSLWDGIYFCGHILDCVGVCYGRILDSLGVSSACAPATHLQQDTDPC